MCVWSRGASQAKTTLFNKHLPTVIRDDTLVSGPPEDAAARDRARQTGHIDFAFTHVHPPTRHILRFPPRPPTSRWYGARASRRLCNCITLDCRRHLLAITSPAKAVTSAPKSEERLKIRKASRRFSSLTAKLIV